MAKDPKSLDKDSRSRPPPGTPGGGPASTVGAPAEPEILDEPKTWSHAQSDTRKGQGSDIDLTPNANRHPPQRPSTPDNIEPGPIPPRGRR